MSHSTFLRVKPQCPDPRLRIGSYASRSLTRCDMIGLGTSRIDISPTCVPYRLYRVRVACQLDVPLIQGSIIFDGCENIRVLHGITPENRFAACYGPLFPGEVASRGDRVSCSCDAAQGAGAAGAWALIRCDRCSMRAWAVLLFWIDDTV